MRELEAYIHGLYYRWVGGKVALLLKALQMLVFSLGIQFLQENTAQLLTWEDTVLVWFQDSEN